MATSISALKLFTKAIIDARPWDHDPLAIRKAWSEEEYQLVEHGGGKGLCFAILWDNKVVKPHPPLIRAMNMVKKALELEGHQGRLHPPSIPIRNLRTLPQLLTGNLSTISISTGML